MDCSNLLTGKWEFVYPEGELIPGETIVKLYYCKRLVDYVTIPGASLSRFQQRVLRSKTLTRVLLAFNRHK